MLDHALRTVSFIADIGDLLVLMVRQTPGDGQDVNASPKPSQILASLSATQTDRKLIKVTCHVFQCAEASVRYFTWHVSTTCHVSQCAEASIRFVAWPVSIACYVFQCAEASVRFATRPAWITCRVFQCAEASVRFVTRLAWITCHVFQCAEASVRFVAWPVWITCHVFQCAEASVRFAARPVTITCHVFQCAEASVRFVGLAGYDHVPRVPVRRGKRSICWLGLFRSRATCSSAPRQAFDLLAWPVTITCHVFQCAEASVRFVGLACFDHVPRVPVRRRKRSICWLGLFRSRATCSSAPRQAFDLLAWPISITCHVFQCAEASVRFVGLACFRVSLHALFFGANSKFPLCQCLCCVSVLLYRT